jgi:ech hydrogenase subunit A
MDAITLWTVALLAVPLAGAAAAALLARLPSGRGNVVAAATTVVTTILTATAVVLAVATSGVLGSGSEIRIGLGPLDPASAAAGVAWSLAPTALALVFVSIGWRTRSRSIIVMATAQLALGVAAAVTELSAGHPVGGGDGSLLLDPLTGLMLAVSGLVGGLVVVYAVGYEPIHLAHRGLAPGRAPAFLAWLLLFLASMHLLVLADDLRLVVVGWELTTLCSWGLIAFDGDRAALVGAHRALLYNLVGGIGLGVAALAAGPGAGLSTVVAEAVGGMGGAIPVLVILGLVVGAVTKSALLPAHPWLLGAMVAAAPVSALLHASTMVKAGGYLLLRLSPALDALEPMATAVAVLGAVTFAGAAVAALRERDLKRALALSTISSLGLIAVGAGIASPEAVAAGALVIAFHAVAKTLAFLTVGSVEGATGTRDVEALAGIARRAPRLAGALLLAAAAMALPPFGLVVAKWALLVAGGPEPILVALLAIGAAAGVALWTMLSVRLLLRRAGPGPAPGRTSGFERAVIATLAGAAAIGLVLAAPVATAIADPVAVAITGTDPRLASGWSLGLGSSDFTVPLVAALFVTSTVAVGWVASRVHRTAPRPYLAGAGLRSGGDRGSPGAMELGAVFRGPAARIDRSASAGFYWRAGGAAGERITSRALLAAGWLGIGLLGLASLLAGTGVGR